MRIALLNLTALALDSAIALIVVSTRRKLTRNRALLQQTLARQEELARFYRTVTLCKPIRTEDFPLIFPPELEGRLQNPLVEAIPHRKSHP